MPTNEQKNLILSLLKSPYWTALKAVRDDILNKLDNEPKSRDTEWDTIRTILGMEGQRQGIIRFFQELDNQAKEAHEQ